MVLKKLKQDPIFLLFFIVFISKAHVWFKCSCMVLKGVTPHSEIVVGDSDSWPK